MLELLRIRNFAIIDSVEIDLATGLTTITGETGAGKSILLDALKMALGDRASADVVRAGTARATIEVIFALRAKSSAKRWLEENDYLDDDAPETLLLRREILSTGSSRHAINGRACTLAQLRDLASCLISIHGQHEHVALLSVADQMDYLDSFAELEDAVIQYRNSLDTFRSAEQALVALTEQAMGAGQRQEFLRFQLDEIASADPSEHEDEDLENEKRRLSHATRLAELAANAVDSLYEGERTEPTVLAQVAQVTKALQELAQLDPEQLPLAAAANELHATVEDLAARLRDYGAQLLANPERLAEVDDRLARLKTLKRKYGPTLADVMQMRARLEEEIDLFENRDEALEKKRADVTRLRDVALAAAAKLSDDRKRAAKRFETQVQKAVRELELPKSEFRVLLTNRAVGMTPEVAARELDARGLDAVEFLVTMNPGEEPKPLRKVASGGEVSRVMLALKAVLADRDHTPVLIFDEIDVGISGEAAARVGSKLRSLAASHQIFAITHLPVVAAAGHQHLVVAKEDRGGRTHVRIASVQGRDRAEALARMISGAQVDETSRKLAESLLARAG